MTNEIHGKSRPWPRQHYVRCGVGPSSPRKGYSSPQFSAHVYWCQTDGCIRIPLGMEVGLSPGNIVLDWNTAPLSKGAPPPILADVRCGQTAKWTKMALVVEVGLGPGDFVLDGNPATPEKRAQPPPICRPMSIVAKSLDGSKCHLVGLDTGNVVLNGDPAAPKMGTACQFSAHVYCGQTAG